MDVPAGLERYRPLVDDWAAFADAVATPLPVCVWTNPLRADASRLGALLDAAGHDPRPLSWRPGAFRLERGDGIGARWWYLVGLCHAQEEASLLPVRLLAPEPGDRVLDLCAAPGGKSAEIAVALGNRGTLVANDVSLPRLRALRGTLDRLGLINVSVTRHDGCSLPPAIGSFDRILVDAPCSGAGTVRRKTGRRVTVRPPSEKITGWQVGLLRKAVRLCRAGGRVVYSTCTFAPEENEAVVDAVLRTDGERYDLRVVPAAVAGLATSPGVDGWDGARYDPSLRHTLRLWPHRADTGGFFAALIEKRADPDPAGDGGRELEARPRDDWRAVAERYGIGAAIEERLVVHHRSNRGLHAAAPDHRPPVAPRVEVTGTRLTSDRAAVPRLTTSGAMLLGDAATRNVVDLDEADAERFLARQDVDPAGAAAAACDAAGVVLARHAGLGLGNGQLRDDGRRLESMFPRRWAGGP